MQTTLLGIGIAIILALGTALIGPVFIDWNGYRAVIEAQASQVVGAPVTVSGPISVRLLPTASLSLDGVEISPAGAPAITVRKIAVEVAPGALMRGEFRASELTVEGLGATLRLDRAGRIEGPVAGLGFDPDRLGIDRLKVSDGRIVLADAASGGRIALESFSFNGDVRSLLGPFKGDGAFTLHDGPYAFRVGGSRRGDDGSVKMHLFVDASASAVSFDADGTLWVGENAPRFEGAVTVSRVVGAALPDGTTAINEPWKVTAKVKATAAAAALDDLAFQYGPEVRPARLTGAAKAEFGARPRAEVALAARQLDLDRTFTGADRHLPFDVVKAMAESLAGGRTPPLPVRVALNVDNLTMAGASISMLRGEAESRADGWAIESLEWRAPGATQMQVGGKLAVAGGKVAFTGPVRIDSTDPAVFFAWIEGRGAAASRASVGPMRGNGVLTLASERIAVEDLSAEIDHKSLAGRAAYRFATAAAPARLDAALTAIELDLDRFLSLAEAVSASTAFERPKEIALALDIGRTTYAGVEAIKTHAVLGFDGAGLKIERLSIADIGGAAVEASGRIDNLQSAGRGSIALSLIAGRIEGFAALATKLMPQAAEPLRKYESRLGPLNVNAKLDVEPGKGGTSAAKLKLTGRIAGIDTNLDASGTGMFSNPGAAALRVDARLDAEDGRTLGALSGLDQFVNMERRPARLTFLAEGAAERSFRVDGRFAAGDLSASAAGTWKIGGDSQLDVAFHAADAKLPRRAPSTVPVDLRGKLVIDKAALKFTDLSGRVAGAAVKGRLAVGLGAVPQVDGRIEADQVDGAELVAILAGAPRPPKGVPAAWPAEPFAAASALPTFAGRIEFRAGTVQWAPGIAARDLQGAVVCAESGFSLDGATGKLGDGRLDLTGRIARASGGTNLQSHIKLVNADLAALLAGVTRVPVTGRISIDAEVQGQGMSPASLVGGLTGGGLATLENVEIGDLDPTAIDAAIVAVDRGLAINSARIADIVNAGLDAGRLRLPFAAAAITIADGRVQLADLAAPAQSADVAASVALALADNQVDMRIALTGPQRNNAPAGDRPSLAVVVKGPLSAARRTADVAPLVNWLTARAVEQETKRLEDAERERKRLEPADARRRQDATVPAGPEAALAATLGRAPELPAAIEIKPTPARRPPPPAPPSRLQLRPPLDLFQQGIH